MREAIDNLRKEVRRELEELRESWKDKFNKIEEKVEEIENVMIEWKEERRRNEAQTESVTEKENRSVSGYSVALSRRSRYREASSTGGSE